VGGFYFLDLALAPCTHLAIFFVRAGFGGLPSRFMRIPERYPADLFNNDSAEKTLKHDSAQKARDARREIFQA